VWFLLRARRANPMAQTALAAVCVLLACQGFVGISQYALELPAELVWLHVSLATFTWLALLWAVAAAGRDPAGGPVAPAPAPERELARSR
jgi:cytochrome c oxidase assembly protein subunit 15